MNEEKYEDIINKYQEMTSEVLNTLEVMVKADSEKQEIHKNERLRSIRMLVIGFVTAIGIVSLVSAFFIYNYFNYTSEYEIQQDGTSQSITNTEGGGNNE